MKLILNSDQFIKDDIVIGYFKSLVKSKLKTITPNSLVEIYFYNSLGNSWLGNDDSLTFPATVVASGKRCQEMLFKSLTYGCIEHFRVNKNLTFSLKEREIVFKTLQSLIREIDIKIISKRLTKR